MRDSSEFKPCQPAGNYQVSGGKDCTNMEPNIETKTCQKDGNSQACGRNGCLKVGPDEGLCDTTDNKMEVGPGTEQASTPFSQEDGNSASGKETQEIPTTKTKV